MGAAQHDPHLSLSAIAPGRYFLPGVGDLAYCDLIRLSPDHAPAPTYLVALLFTAVRARGRGLARDLMEAIMAAADSEGATLVLKPAALSPSALSDEALASFYARLGFVPVAGGYVERLPAPLASAPSLGASMKTAV